MAKKFNEAIGSDPIILSNLKVSEVVLDLQLSNTFIIHLNRNITLSFRNQVHTFDYKILFIQDSVGSRTVTMDGNPISVTTTPFSVSELKLFTYKGDVYHETNSEGTVTSVNNVSPDINGNITIPIPTVDYSAQPAVFSESIPFTESRGTYTQIQATGQLDFVPNVTGARIGSVQRCLVDLNGVDPDTFTFVGFTNEDTVSVPDTTAGYINILWFWCEENRPTRVFKYKWGQSYQGTLPAEADITAPTLSNFSISDSNPNRVYFNSSEVITATTFTGFTISGQTITGITISAGQTTGHYFTVSANFLQGGSHTILYTTGSNLQDTSGSPLAAFNATAITNNISNPTLASASVENATDNRLNMNFSESVTITTAGWIVSATGGAVSINSVTGSGTSTPYFTLSRSIAEGETVTVSYSGGVTTDLGGNPLGTITNQAVTNNVTANLAPVASSVAITLTPNVAQEGNAVTGSYTYFDNESDPQDITSNGSLFELKTYADATAANADTTNVSGTTVASGYTGGNAMPQLNYTIVTGDVGRVLKLWVRPVAQTGNLTGVWAGSAASATIIAATSYEAEYTALYNDYSVKPGTTDQINVNAVIAALKAGGVWAKTDQLILPGIHTGASDADRLLNIKRSVNINASFTVKAESTFTNYSHVKLLASAAACGLRSNLNPNTGSYNYKLNDCMMVIGLRNNYQENAHIMGGHEGASDEDRVYYYPRSTADQAIISMQGSGGKTISGKTTRVGYHAIGIPSSNNLTYWHNSTKTTFTTVPATGIINCDPGIGSYGSNGNYNKITPESISPQVNVFWMGAYLSDAEYAVLRDTIEAYYDNYGTGIL